ncbi:acetylornithine aminotransferase, partial [Cladochytrium tenue]
MADTAATPPPSEQTRALSATQSHLLELYAQPAGQFFVQGRGCALVDADGREFLDVGAGIAVNALGHGDAEVAAAVADQAGRLIHLSNLYRNEYAGRLADMLVDRLAAAGTGAPGDLDAAAAEWWDGAKVFFGNSGTEANEAAFKFARKHAKVTRTKTSPSGEPVFPYHVLSFQRAFHGRTMGALSATPNAKYQAPFAPLVPGFDVAEYNNVAGLDRVDWTGVCAAIIEPVQGEGGVWVADDAFLRELRRRCDEVGALLIFDEIQCGLGRTGHTFAHQRTGVRPDIISLAKPLANGLPIGATVLARHVAANIKPGDHGTTFGGGPLATRVALLVLERLSSGTTLARVRAAGERLGAGLEALAVAVPGVVEGARGVGLIRGLQLRPRSPGAYAAGAEASRFVQLCHARGVLAISAGHNTVRVVPPLIISDAEIDRALAVFGDVARAMDAEAAAAKSA